MPSSRGTSGHETVRHIAGFSPPVLLNGGGGGSPGAAGAGGGITAAVGSSSVGTRDATNSFKAYSTTFVREVGIDSDAGFEIGIELVAKARRLRRPVAEVPTIWLERHTGASSFKLVGWIPRYLDWYRFAFGPALSLERRADRADDDLRDDRSEA